MKKAVIIGMLLAFSGSCYNDKELVIPEKKPDEPPAEFNEGNEELPENENDTSMIVVNQAALPTIVLVDSAYNDRLNPKSLGYWGEAYVKGIEVFSLHEGRRITSYDAYQLSGGGSLFSVDDPSIFYSPVRPRKNDKVFRPNSLGYYFLTYWIAKDAFRYDHSIYVCYSDGTEDEMKVHLYVSKNRMFSFIDKIWINGELAYAMSEAERMYWDGRGLTDVIELYYDYYNPKYYPWLEPVINDEGKQVNVRPINADHFITIMK
jgi:hypothetical protein